MMESTNTNYLTAENRVGYGQIKTLAHDVHSRIAIHPKDGSIHAVEVKYISKGHIYEDTRKTLLVAADILTDTKIDGADKKYKPTAKRVVKHYQNEFKTNNDKKMNAIQKANLANEFQSISNRLDG